MTAFRTVDRRLALALCVLVTAAGCGSDEGAAPTPPPQGGAPTAGTTAAEPPPATTGGQLTPAPPAGDTAPLPDVATRLLAAGFNLVRQPLPANVPGVEGVFVTGAGPIVVYVSAFDAIDPAKAYARARAREARRSRGYVLVRRADENVYVGTATDAAGRRQLRRQLGRVVAAGEATP